MSKLFKRFSAGVAVVGSGILVLGVVAYAAGARINTSKSIPVGLYWTNNQPVEKGVYVLFCPPQNGVFFDAKERGYIGAGVCPGNLSYMMKRVLAAKNDVVSVADDGVRVNGGLLPFSAPFGKDKSGRLMPHYRAADYSLSEYQVLLMADVSSTSFDGRYFGPIQRSQIKTVIFPVITW